MKKFYYYSNSKIHTLDLKHFYNRYRPFLWSVIGVILLSGGFAVYSIWDSFIHKNDTAIFLTKKYSELNNRYEQLENELVQLREKNTSLRTAVSLPPVSSGQEIAGTGGGTIGNIAEILAREGNIASVLDNVEKIIRRFESEKNNLREIQSAFNSNQQLYKSLPAIKPCSGEVMKDGFGMRYHPILHYTRMHEGIDINTDIGTDVVATADGVVSFSGYRNGYGIAVMIEHGNGYATLYGHLSQGLVREGQKVVRGQRIAFSGNTGLSTGPHLHYEVSRYGIKLNPENFFFDSEQLFVNGPKNEENRY